MSDVTKLIVIVTFFSSMAFIGTLFGTELYNTATYDANYTNNETVIGYGYENVPAPPVCTSFAGDYVPLLGDLIDGAACVGGFIVWMISLMFIKATNTWVNILFFLPIMAALGFIIIRTIRGN